MTKFKHIVRNIFFSQVTLLILLFDAVGIFSPDYKFLPQLVGAVVVGAVSFVSSFAIFFALKKTTGIRVSEEEELRGLDLCEHGGKAYPGFQFFVNM